MKVECLTKEQIAKRLGVKPRTASALMMEMNPVPICGKTRKRYVVTEDNFQQWLSRKMIGKPKAGATGKGSNKRLERR